jgi:serine/threonine-protein kinase HipA
MFCTFEIHTQGRWLRVAQFEVRVQTEVDKGYLGSGFLTYDENYATEHLSHTGINALSCRYPVNYELYQDNAWPSFLLDLLPSGAGRRHWLNQLSLIDGPKADWPLLLKGASNPPGNIRIAEAVHSLPTNPHVGFDYTDILKRKEGFMEYAQTHGAPVTGSTGAQGDAPKFLLAEDCQGKWHAEGALADELTARHWLVKFPRGKEKSDRKILKK